MQREARQRRSLLPCRHGFAPHWLTCKPWSSKLPIVGSTTADSDELGEDFRAFLKSQEQDGELPNTPATRVASMLSAIAGMHFRPEQRNEPFGAMVTFADGRRSAVPEDFRGHVETLTYMAERAVNPVLRASLSDVCWLLDRKRGKLGSHAISTYIEIVQKADAGELKWRFANDEEKEDPGLQYDARDYLRRALHIGRSIGWDKPEMIVPRELVVQLRKRANGAGMPVPVQWFSGLDLDFRISDPVDIGAVSVRTSSAGTRLSRLSHIQIGLRSL